MRIAKYRKASTLTTAGGLLEGAGGGGGCSIGGGFLLTAASTMVFAVFSTSKATVLSQGYTFTAAL